MQHEILKINIVNLLPGEQAFTLFY